MTEKTETNLKDLKFKVGERVRITNDKNILSKDYTENRAREISVINSVLKTTSWTYKIKNLDGEIIIGSFYEVELLLSKL